MTVSRRDGKTRNSAPRIVIDEVAAHAQIVPRRIQRQRERDLISCIVKRLV